jgi:hypothetical protein
MQLKFKSKKCDKLEFQFFFSSFNLFYNLRQKKPKH